MIGKREPAKRVFAFELNSSTYEIADDTKTKYNTNWGEV
jgi:RPA family protein